MWKQETEQLCFRDTPGPQGLGVSPPGLPPGEGWDGQPPSPPGRQHTSHGAQEPCDSSLSSQGFLLLLTTNLEAWGVSH